MSIGTAIQDALQRKGMCEKDLAEKVFVSRPQVNHWKHGRRQITKESLRRINEAMHDMRLQLASIEYVTGGVLGQTLDGLDGTPATALHVASVELEEAMEFLRKARRLVIQCPSRVDKSSAMEVALEVMEGLAALNEFLAAWACRFKLDPQELGRRHKGRLLERGYKKSRSGGSGLNEA